VSLPSGENANNTTNFVVTADDRVNLALFGELGKVDRILVESIKALLSVLALDPTVAANFVDGCLESSLVKASFFEDSGDRGILDESKQEVILSLEQR
jgi:hypothetical protein